LGDRFFGVYEATAVVGNSEGENLGDRYLRCL